MSDPYQLDRRLVARAFNAAAATYEAHAVLQATVARRLEERLDLFRIAPSRVLDIGAGCGNGIPLLRRRYAKAEIVAIDVALEMLRRARSKVTRWFPRERFVCAGAERLPMAEASADLIFSNLTLQWCNDLDAAFREFRRVLRPGGLLLFSTFGPDTLKELRESWAAADSDAHVHAFLDMHDVGDALIRAGFSGPVMDVEHVVVTYKDVRALMRELKAIGAHNVSLGRFHGLTGKNKLRVMIQAYERHRRDGVIPATHEVVYGHAWAPTPDTRPQDGSTVAYFPVANLRGRRS